ncbi:hypothetical protein LDO31_02960 [Luteimonas sp. XNQY3]|nr:hypothetical protein [Luteimonas sp. XNQY3]MCD9005207.1 hypothetical protein [Luteimonas sp. XNQY3]
MNNAIYFIREAQGNWTACSAQTIGAAKRAAVRGKIFQGTDAWVGRAIGSRIEPIAVKRADALNMSAKGRWVELDPDNASVSDYGVI